MVGENYKNKIRDMSTVFTLNKKPTLDIISCSLNMLLINYKREYRQGRFIEVLN